MLQRKSQVSFYASTLMNWNSRLRGPALRGVADQALTSAENFAVGIILVRGCTKAEFGLYGLGYGILVLGWTLIAGLITAQMTAALAKETLIAEERRAQYGWLLRALLIVCLATTGCGCLLILVLRQLHLLPAYDTYYWLFLSAALPGVCLRDFMRRYFFQERSESRALLMDASALALTVAILGGVAALHVTHLNSIAVATLAVGGLAVGTCGVVAGGLSPRAHNKGAFAGFRALWRAGRWNIGATIVSWIQIQAYTFFVTAMLGLSGLAAANAPRVLLTPVTLLSTGLALPLLPRFAKQRTNLHAVVGFRSVRGLLAMTLAFVGVYTFALWLARDRVVPLILGGRYTDIWPCIVAWGFANVFMNIRMYYSTFLLAKRSFRRLAAANVLSAAAVVSLTAPLIHFYGVVGSVYSIAAGELLFGLASLYQCRVVAAAIQANCAAPPVVATSVL
jgi:O-antigen/teichoic acid export membrane protein